MNNCKIKYQSHSQRVIFIEIMSLRICLKLTKHVDRNENIYGNLLDICMFCAGVCKWLKRQWRSEL